jgi:hypothetical protein
MKILKYTLFSLVYIAVVAVGVACEKVVSPLPEFETGVVGFAKNVTSADLFNQTKDTAILALSSPATPAQFDFRWLSVDNKNTVTKIEFFVTFTEKYKDVLDNEKTANHGTKLLRTLDGAAVPANRIFIKPSFTIAEVNALFKDTQFDYGKGGGKKNVFDQNGRTATAQFTKSDAITVTWNFITADGRKFTTWSVALCGEAAGSNCAMKYSFR